MNIQDSLRLCFINFKTFRSRIIFPAIILALGVVPILMFLIADNSIRRIIKEAYPNRYKTYFLEIREFIRVEDYEETMQRIPSVSELKSIYGDKYDIKGIYREMLLRSPTVMLGGTDRPYSLKSIDPYLSKELVADGYSFDNKYDGKIPIILNPVYAAEILLGYKFEHTDDLESIYIDNGNIILDPSQSRLIRTLRTLDTNDIDRKLYGCIGQEIKVSIVVSGSETISFQGLVVGYDGSIESSKMGINSAGIIIPEWFISENDEVGRLFSDDRIDQIAYVFEFDSYDKRSRFFYEVATGLNKDMLPPNRDLSAPSILIKAEEWMKYVLNPLPYVCAPIPLVLLIIAIISMNINLLKVIEESKKGIGVSGTISTQKSDIVKISMSYVFIVLVVGFILGLVLAFGINASLSVILYDLHYGAIFTWTPNIFNRPLFVLVGFPILEILMFFIILMLIVFLAAIFPVLLVFRHNVVKALRSR